MMSDWQPYEQPYRPPVRVAHTNGFAIAALACGIGGLFLFPALIAAVVLGHMALRQIRETGERGYGMATAGLVLGYIGLVVVILLIVMFIIGVMALGKLELAGTGAAADRSRVRRWPGGRRSARRSPQ